MSEAQAATAPDDTGMQSSSFDVLRARLGEHGKNLLAQAGCPLNAARLAEFGRQEMVLRARTRARTDNNCVARDLVRVGEVLLFGYNVFIGLRQETRVADVFALYRLRQDADGAVLEPLPLEGSFLAEARFLAEFKELYSYYKNAQLVQLRVHQGKLLASFKIGERISDVRVFRWQIGADGALSYIDNRGERDIALPLPHDFEWTPTTREQHVTGRHPHVNILDTLFVETMGGDLTVKIENNTESGLGIYSEPVEDRNQSLSDSEIAYAAVGELILLRIKPYREQDYRYLVFNRRSEQVLRIDAIGASCVQLPEDQGIVFPDGYFLQSGETRIFADLPPGLRFKRPPALAQRRRRAVRVLRGRAGRLRVAHLQHDQQDPGRAPGGPRRRPVRRWQHAAVFRRRRRTDPLAQHATVADRLRQRRARRRPGAAPERTGQDRQPRAGARPVGAGRMIAKAVREQAEAARDALPGRFAFEALVRQCRRAIDACHWLDGDVGHGAGAELQAMIGVAWRHARRIRQGGGGAPRRGRHPGPGWPGPARLAHRYRGLPVAGASRLHRRAGTHPPGARESGHAARDALPGLGATGAPGRRTGSRRGAGGRAHRRLPGPGKRLHAGVDLELAAQRAQLDTLHSVAELQPLYQALARNAATLDGLTELLGTLGVGDATLRTRILHTISGRFADVNKLRAQARQRRKQLAQGESAAEFAAQFQLFGQSVDSALEQADAPERCDELLTRLLAQLEELEARFSEQEDYLTEIAIKRESVVEALEGRKQALLDARARAGDRRGGAPHPRRRSQAHRPMCRRPPDGSVFRRRRAAGQAAREHGRIAQAGQRGGCRRTG
ncbi:DNA repair ATPase [Massilia sp. B-10]|nr:DNA repair ATPase [Massilia sp. B-10]